MAIVINGSGTLTGVSVGGLPDGIVDTDMLATDAVSAAKLQSTAIASGDLPTGSILQVIQTVNSGVESTTVQDTYEDLPGMSLSITPASTDNKILITVCIGKISNSGTNVRQTNFRLMRDTTAIALGDQLGSNRMRATMGSGSMFENNDGYGPGGLSFSFLDSPSTTSATTYKVQWGGQAGQTHYLNRVADASDVSDAPFSTTISSITAMEVAG